MAEQEIDLVELRRLEQWATPGPWRDSAVDGNRFGALVADMPHPDRPNPEAGGWAWEEDYGGCLVGESLMAADRAFIAAARNALPELLNRLEAAERLVDMWQSSPQTRAFVIDRYPGLAHSIDALATQPEADHG